MSNPLQILVLGKDPSLFDTASELHIGDARRRHIFYANRLRARFPGSELRVLTYTERYHSSTQDEPCDGLRLYGTSSIHRATYTVDLLRQLRTVLADGWRPDVVTAQTPWEDGFIGLLVARWSRARFIPQLHFDMFSPDWAAEHWLNRWRRWVGRIILRHANRVRVVSKPLRDKVATHCGVPRERIDVAPVPVCFQPAAGNKRDFKARLGKNLGEHKIVLFVGRLCAQKNLSLWLDVAHHIAKTLARVSFVIVGDGPDARKLRKRVMAAGLAERFIFVGPKPHKALPSIYAAADVFLLTSNYEGFGRAVLEALLSGVPVVSTACIGPEDLIDHGRNGYLLPCGDAEELARCVEELLHDDALAAAFGTAGQKRVQSEFSLEVITDRLIDCWATK
jgi:glycosyltransferase involved in cell wall biosynthesis